MGFLLENPIVLALALLVGLITAAPLLRTLNKGKKRPEPAAPHFMGAELDLMLLVFGVLLLLALVAPRVWRVLSL